MKTAAGSVRLYGKAPFSVAVLHGGPGAPGEMAPVARELARVRGILEPLQTETSIAGQVAGLREILLRHGSPPFILAGHSWGAWLAIIFASRHPELVARLVLVGCAPMEEGDAASIMQSRLSRLSGDERGTLLATLDKLKNIKGMEKDVAMAEMGRLMAKADAFDPLPPENGDEVSCRADVFESVWGEAQELRRSGALSGLLRKLHCPIVVIHGDADPHPAEGVCRPLREAGCDVKFIPLARCGHTPWQERHARKGFFRILSEETAPGNSRAG